MLEVAVVPVIASGGMGAISHLVDLINKTAIDAIAIANVLHYKTISLSEIYETLGQNDIEVRH